MCVHQRSTEPNTNMKIKSIIAICSLLSALCFFSGCATRPTPQSIQNKSKGIAYLVTAESLIQHPDWKEHFKIASAEFQVLGTSTNVTLPMITEIVTQLPIKELKGERAAIYITVGTLFLQDDLGEVALTQPEELRRAALGIHEGIDLAVNLAR